MVLQGATDWALRRLLKILLKRTLKGVLATELDVEQLRVSLGTGSLELTDVLISPEWLAEQAAPGLEVASGYIGRLALSVAVTSLTCALHLEDVLVVVRPGAAAAPPPAPAEPEDAGADAAPAIEVSGGVQGGPGIDEGVRLVAAGVETLLQRMTVTLSRLTVRVEGGAAGSGAAASLCCTQLCYGPAAMGPEEQGSHIASTSRQVAFGGLSLSLAGGQDGSSAPLLAPLSGQADVTVTWPLDGLPGHQPHVAMAASLEPVQLQLRPPDVASLLALGCGYAAALGAAAPGAGGRPSGAAPLPPPAQQQRRQQALGRQLAAVPGHRSFLEDLMLPGVPEAAVQDALLESAASVTGQEGVDEFFDAKSLLGSLQQAFSSAMSASYTSAAGSSAWGPAGSAWAPGGGGSTRGGSGGGGGGDAAGGPTAEELDLLAMHELAASIREAGGAQRMQLSATLRAPSLALVLLYPEGAGGGSPLFVPRLVAEALDVVLHAESGGSAASGSGSGSGSSGGSFSLSVGELEVAEHLAFPSAPSPAGSAASSAVWGGAWLPAEEMARVPSVLPPAQHFRWSAPTSAGDYPLPDEASSLGGIGSTLAQLSDLSQATVFQSAAAGMESLQLQSIACQDAAAAPRVQIVPVLRCGGGGSGAALVLLFASMAAEPGQDAPAGADVTLLLQPCSVWCTLPLLAHLQAFAAAVAQQLGGADADQQDGGSSEPGAAAIGNGSLQQQQQQQQQQQPSAPAGGLRLSMFLPAACVVVAVPGPPCQPGQPKYFAADVRGSSSQLLASMAPRMGSQRAKALVASLHSSGVQPTIVLQQGGDDAAGGAWTCAVHTGSAALYIVAEAATPAGLGESVLGPALSTSLVASIEGGTPRGAGGLSVDVQWHPQPSPAAAGVMESLWETAGGDPGCQPEHAALRQQLSSGAALLAAVRSSSPIELVLEQATVAAAGRLADGLLQLSAAPPPLEPATQAALQLDCDLLCMLRLPEGAPFSLAARSLRVAACSSIAGVAGSSCVAAAVGSLELARVEGGSSQLLAHASGQQSADGQRSPALQLLLPLRPTAEPYMLCSNGRYCLPCEGRAAVAGSVVTLLLREPGQLGWLADLQSFSGAPGSDAGSASQAAGAAWAGGELPAPPAPALDWAVGLSSSAVRYEPLDASMAAAVLTAGSISWQARRGQSQSSVHARRLALHVAGPSSSSGARGSPAKGLQCGFASSASQADMAGFHQVAAEAGISIQLPQQAQQQQADPQQPGQAVQQAAAMQEVVVTNRGLSISLSRRTLLLLQRLAQQLPSRGPGQGTQRAASAMGASVILGWEGSAASLAASVASACSEGGRQGAPLNVMQGVVQSAYAAPRRPAEHPMEASVFLDGGWYDPEERGGGGAARYAMSPAGSPPAELGSFMEHAAPEGSGWPPSPAAAQEGQGVWYGGGVEVQEEYEALQAPDEAEMATCFGSPGFDCLALPPEHPRPLRRVSLREISITITLADTFTTVLLPEDSSEDEEGLLLAPDSPGSPRGAARRRGSGSGEEEELVPLSAQVQARLEGLCLQLDSFALREAGGEEDGAALEARCALLLRNFEVRDSFQPRQGGGAAPGAGGAAATGWADLRRMLGYHASPRRVRSPGAAMLQLVAEGVRAEPGADLEHRLQVQLLPLLLHLDQAALAFLRHCFAAAEEEQEGGPAAARGAPAAAAAGGRDAGEPPAEAGSGGGGGAPAAGAASSGGAAQLFFQRCEVQPFTLTLNYRPHRVDLAALSSGQLSEVLNLVPWGGVSLQFRHLRLFGMQGLEGIGTAVASAYIEDIARFQAHRFVGGLAPIKSICRVSSAAATLVAIPHQQLYKRASGGAGGQGLSLAALADEDFRRQMQRGLAGFVRAVALEACNLGATVAAGAEVALAGEASASHTAGTKQALRQASAHLRSTSSGPRSAASAAATAVRTALLGMRNTLDREQTLERRLNQ